MSRSPCRGRTTPTEARVAAAGARAIRVRRLPRWPGAASRRERRHGGLSFDFVASSLADVVASNTAAASASVMATSGRADPQQRSGPPSMARRFSPRAPELRRVVRKRLEDGVRQIHLRAEEEEHDRRHEGPQFISGRCWQMWTSFSAAAWPNVSAPWASAMRLRAIDRRVGCPPDAESRLWSTRGRALGGHLPQRRGQLVGLAKPSVSQNSNASRSPSPLWALEQRRGTGPGVAVLGREEERVAVRRPPPSPVDSACTHEVGHVPSRWRRRRRRRSPPRSSRSSGRVPPVRRRHQRRGAELQDLGADLVEAQARAAGPVE